MRCMLRPALTIAAMAIAASAGAHHPLVGAQLASLDPRSALAPPDVGAELASAQQEPARFVSSSSDLVVVPVVVTDRHDRIVAGLPQNRFAIFDNGRPQQVSLFSEEDTPVTIGLVVDNSGSMTPKMAEVVNAALAFARTSNPHDELFITSFDDSVHDNVGGEMLSVSDAERLAPVLRSIRPQGRTALYDGIMAAIAHAAHGTRPRKVLILISDGGDNASRATQKDVLAEARASNATIYTLGLFDPEDADVNPGVLKSLAQETGGERFLPNSADELRAACEHIAREIRSGYTIGYVPPDRDGAYHRVRVEVNASDRGRVNVRARPGYIAGAPVASRH